MASRDRLPLGHFCARGTLAAAAPPLVLACEPIKRLAHAIRMHRFTWIDSAGRARTSDRHCCLSFTLHLRGITGCGAAKSPLLGLRCAAVAMQPLRLSSGCNLLVVLVICRYDGFILAFLFSSS